MKFLAIFLALLILWRLPAKSRSIKSPSFQRWLALFQKIKGFAVLPAWLQYILIVLLPSAAFVALALVADSLLWGLPGLALELMVLVFVLMHADSSVQLEQYQQRLEANDVEGAVACAASALNLPEELLNADSITLNEQVIKALLNRWFEYFFLMLFWYLLADVGGLVLAWLSLQYAQCCGQNSIAKKAVHWLGVLPTRLLGLTYGLAGSLTHALPVWRKHLLNWHTSNEDVLFDVAASSLSMERTIENPEIALNCAAIELREWQRLHNYCISIWLVIIAIATLGGWLL